MRRFKENLLKALIFLSVFFTIACLVSIVGFIFIKGISKLNLQFLTSGYSTTGASGILPMIITTLYTVALSILIATPLGILSAIYLQEYAKQGRLVTIVRFATEALAGIPSIIYGLFGGIFFVVTLGIGYSILAGSLTLSIIILPVIIRTTEEALKTVPQVYKEGSLALGATKFQTLYKVILPSAIPGILSGIILSVGRIIGESAAVLLTAGTVANMPGGIFDSARTLTVHSYLLTKESGDISAATGVGIVLIVLVFVLNILTKFVVKKFNRANY
ncbi:phosphate ABC transporter permease PstA [Clostridioides mangenotii]|uniref:phosphate ABC transporter permease PstA n=1 Tax=Metaclostridioides mangenotii TaxID=1540 RepID=UPI001C117134|nr:phosphate ABC transporter permease PstA [Clostridioides mangenotii]MBU5307107.1 phosphate ABC transporter permease PstA [Clostridioides mangenotii]MCR1953885.1 phosphate ABC transporter permease PstA [Clostridioides mangenotii]